MIQFDHDSPHILISRTDQVRDIVLTLPMVKAIRQKYPKAIISLLVSEDSYDFAKLYSDVDKIYIYDAKGQHKGFLGFFRLAKVFQNENFDAVIAVYPRFYLALFFLYLLIPNRIGTSRRFYSLLYNYRIKVSRKKGKSHETTYNLRLLPPLGIDKTAKDLIFPSYIPRDYFVKKIDVFLEENSIKQFIVLQPAKDGNGPVWPTSYMEDLIYLILKRLPFNIILLETENSELFIQSIIQKISRKLSGTDANRLFRFRTFRTEERAALLQKATLFIGNYNSCHHIAVAMGVSSIVLYPLSPGMSPQRYSSYGPGDFVALTPHLEPCTKCIQKKCEYKNCLSYIFPEIVFEEMKKLIDTPIKKES